MFGLRPYKACDAKFIASWIKTEKVMFQWSSDRFGTFPITGEKINEKYLGNNGDCPEPDNFYPVTAYDETGVVGHMILRYVDSEKKTIRFGFVVVDDAKRGSGYGKKMIKLAQKYAFEILGAAKVTIGVFENNPSAYHCYKSAGFQEDGEPVFANIKGESWKCIELGLTAEDYALLKE